MAKQGPVIVIDDDADNCELMQEAFKRLEIKNGVRCFSNGAAALDYLRTTPEQPFIILSDINMPIMDGIELRRQIEGNPFLKQKSIPFVFLTTTAAPSAIAEAYQLSVQGVFEKGVTLQETQNLLSEIYHYWQRCKHPNS